MATVRKDFLLDPDQRLTEQERALMTAMLHCLVGDVADELRAALPPRLAVANDDSSTDLVRTLAATRLLDHPDIMGMLLRRADEEQISSTLRAQTGRREARVLQGLVSDSNGAISAAAMALILARGRRRDRFGQCLIDLDDFSGPTAALLASRVAALLRQRMPASVDPRVADDALDQAVRDLLGRHDPARGVDSLTATLVGLLDDGERLDDSIIGPAAEEGEIGLLAHALARRAALDGETMFDELLSGNSSRAMVALRMAGVSRELAAAILGAIGDQLDLPDLVSAIDQFDGFSDEQVAAAHGWLLLDPAYRDALAALGEGHGQRSV